MGTDQGNGIMTERLRQLESLTSGVVRRTAEPVAVPEDVASVPLIPAPRRVPVFLRHGEGHGTFAELTLTGPAARSSVV